MAECCKQFASGKYMLPVLAVSSVWKRQRVKGSLVSSVEQISDFILRRGEKTVCNVSWKIGVGDPVCCGVSRGCWKSQHVGFPKSYKGPRTPSEKKLSDSRFGYPRSIYLMLSQEGLQQWWAVLRMEGAGIDIEGERHEGSTEVVSKWQCLTGLSSCAKRLRRCGNRCCRLDGSVAASGVGWLQINNQHPVVALNQGLNLWQRLQKPGRGTEIPHLTVFLSHFCFTLS